MKSRVYLDYAAATPLDPEVKKAILDVSQNFSNPSAQYASARAQKKLLEQARKDVAMFLQANADEVLFTSGATEANNLAIFGSARAVGKGHIVSLSTEHASVREPIKQLRQEGFEVTWCKVKPDGTLPLDTLRKALRPDTILVSISFANSEVGTIQPIQKFTKLVKDYNSKIIIHTDASAAALLLSCDVSRLGVDLLTMGGSKIYGPHGIGALYIKRGTGLKPLMYGGNQELGLRPGTEPVDLVVGLAKALQVIQARRGKDEQLFKDLHTSLIQILSEQGAVVQTGSVKSRLYNIASLSFAGVNGEDIVAHMDAAGFEVASGAACEAAKAEPSPALLALGLTKSQAQGSVRISFGRSTTQAEVEAAAGALVQTLKTLGYHWKAQ